MSGSGKAGDLDKEIAGNLRRTRLSLGISAKHVAGQAGITPQQLSYYENGQTRITVGRLVELARVLRVAPADLLPAA